MNNPFETILDKLDQINTRLENLPLGTVAPAPEIINADEICKRLDISGPTLIKWRQRRKIPFIKIGSSIRYNWPAVIDFLSKSGSK